MTFEELQAGDVLLFKEGASLEVRVVVSVTRWYGEVDVTCFSALRDALVFQNHRRYAELPDGWIAVTP